MTDLAHILKALGQQPESETWGTIVEKHGHELHGIALSVLGDSHLAEDATQNTLLAIRDNAHTFQDAHKHAEARAHAWIRRIACLQSLQLLRSRTNALKRERLFSRHNKITIPSPEEQTMQTELSEQIRTELACMPEQQQLPLILAYYGNLDNQAIARELGCSNGAARTRIHRCLKVLQKRLLRIGVSCSLVAITSQMHASTETATPALLSSWNDLLTSQQTGSIPTVTLHGIALATKIAAACIAITLGTLITLQFNAPDEIIIKPTQHVPPPQKESVTNVPEIPKMTKQATLSTLPILEKETYLYFLDEDLEAVATYLTKLTDIPFTWSNKEEILKHTHSITIKMSSSAKIKNILEWIAKTANVIIREKDGYLHIELPDSDATPSFISKTPITYNDQLRKKLKEKIQINELSIEINADKALDSVLMLGGGGLQLTWSDRQETLQHTHLTKLPSIDAEIENVLSWVAKSAHITIYEEPDHLRIESTALGMESKFISIMPIDYDDQLQKELGKNMGGSFPTEMWQNTEDMFEFAQDTGADIPFIWSDKQAILEHAKKTLNFEVNDMSWENALAWMALDADLTIRKEMDHISIELTQKGMKSGFISRSEPTPTDYGAEELAKELLPISFSSATIKDVTCFMRQATGLNFIIDHNIRGNTINLEMKNTSLQDVLTKMTQDNGLKYTIQNEAVYITAQTALPTNNN